MNPSPLHKIFLQYGARMEGLRPLDFGDPKAEYGALSGGVGVVDRSGLTKLLISGADARDWLQGQVTNDMRALPPGGEMDCLVCAPTGQVVADCRLWEREGRFLLFGPEGRAKALRERLERFLIMEDVTVEDVTREYALLSLFGPGVDEAWLAGRGLDRFEHAPHGFLPLPGTDLLVPEAEALGAAEALVNDAAPVGLTAFEIARIEWGVPLYGAEIDEHTLPQEMGARFEEKFISYTKGCYTGQETVMRIHSRGHTNRTLVGIRWESEVPAGTEIGGGTVTSSCRSFALDVPISLAVARNEPAEVGAEVNAGGVRGVVAELPFVGP